MKADEPAKTRAQILRDRAVQERLDDIKAAKIMRRLEAKKRKRKQKEANLRVSAHIPPDTLKEHMRKRRKQSLKARKEQAQQLREEFNKLKKKIDEHLKEKPLVWERGDLEKVRIEVIDQVKKTLTESMYVIFTFYNCRWYRVLDSKD